ncbi:MAG: nuclear transport factor 2 family protein [Spirochaetes bacterium]|nr:nuclear transport factor 2 family protein [Spirochaetota bacterium]
MEKQSIQQENIALIQRLYKSIESFDFNAYMELLRDDIVYHAAGNCPVSGTHKGKKAIAEIGRITFEETKGTHRVKLKELIANKSYATAIDTWSAARNGKTICMDNIIVYKIESGKVSEIFEFIEDEKEHDEFWR